MMRPNFEEPLDTAKQMVEKNITLYFIKFAQIQKQFLLLSSIPEYNILGDNVIFAENWEHYYNITRDGVIGAGTHAQMTSAISPPLLALGKWHRSKERVSGNNPYTGFLTKKKWHLNEEMAKHLLHFQQVDIYKTV